MREQPILRIDAVVALVLVAADVPVDRQLGVVAREDQAARDLLLLEQRPPVQRVVLEALGADHAPPGREPHEEQEEHRRDHEQAADLAVHRTSPPPSASGSRRARSDTIKSSASSTKLATIDAPPYETNGSVTPVSGMTFVTPPTITNTWIANTAPRPVASSFAKPSVASVAVLNARAANRRPIARMAQPPNSPTSFTITA